MLLPLADMAHPTTGQERWEFMPELPEVETIRRQLSPQVVGREIIASSAFESDRFLEAVLAIGAHIESVSRRGKYLIFSLSAGQELIVHLGMTGALQVAPTLTEDPYCRAWWKLSATSGQQMFLTFRDIRRFGKIAVVAADDYSRLPTLRDLGPEPLSEDFTPDWVREFVNRRSRFLKTHLLGQRLVAGVGNIYADEALWRAAINPSDRSISRRHATLLVEHLREVLASSIEHGGTTFRDYVNANGARGGHQHHLDCYGRAGEPCRRCGTTLTKGVLDARTSNWCPACQPRRRRPAPSSART